ncbi:MAG: GxxExxY protein, partial [Planctomycetota bacterium]|nr:GxxExxY protein [Planctomycetota bacterium]
MNEQEKEEWELEEHGCRPRVRRVKEVDDPLTYGVIGAAQKVHTTLGPGFVEATYQRALSLELVARKIPFDTEREFEVFYNGVLCGTYRADMVIGGTLIVELKAVTDLAQEHFAQTISYLRASGLQLALLVNFGARSLPV